MYLVNFLCSSWSADPVFCISRREKVHIYFKYKYIIVNCNVTTTIEELL
jgi:hypothetical protein